MHFLFAGVFIIGMGVSCYRIAGFGTDPIWIAVGIGIIIHAFANGPLVQKLSEYIRIDSDAKD